MLDPLMRLCQQCSASVNVKKAKCVCGHMICKMTGTIIIAAFNISLHPLASACCTSTNTMNCDPHIAIPKYLLEPNSQTPKF